MGPLTCESLVRPAGLEPATYGLEAMTPVVRKKCVWVRNSAFPYTGFSPNQAETYGIVRIDTIKIRGQNDSRTLTRHSPGTYILVLYFRHLLF